MAPPHSLGYIINILLCYVYVFVVLFVVNDPDSIVLFDLLLLLLLVSFATAKTPYSLSSVSCCSYNSLIVNYELYRILLSFVSMNRTMCWGGRGVRTASRDVHIISSYIRN